MSGIEIVFSVEESPEGGYEAQALGHSIFTEADTMEELKTLSVVTSTRPADRGLIGSRS